MESILELQITLPGLPSLRQTGAFGNFFARSHHDRKWAKQVILATRDALLWDELSGITLQKVTLHCVRASSVKPDYDNLAYSFKPLVDAFLPQKKETQSETRMGLLESDDDSVIVSRSYTWVPAKIGAGYVSLRLSGQITTG